MFFLVIIEALLMMCSQLADALADSLCDRNLLSQYTQALSRSRISVSNSAGIFQLFAMSDLDAFTHNALITRRRMRSLNDLVIKKFPASLYKTALTKLFFYGYLPTYKDISS